MKTEQFFFAALLAVCTLSMAALTCCGEKNKPSDPTTPTTPTEVKPVAALMDMSVMFSEKTLEIFDISFDYLDENGQKKSDKVKSSPWNVKVQSTGLPAKLGFYMNVAIKEGLDRSKYESFELDFRFSELNCLVDADGKQLGVNHGGEAGFRQGLLMSAIDYYVNEAYPNHPFSSLHSYDANGNWTLQNWE